MVKGSKKVSEFEYTITDKLGIHARPAGLLVNIAKKYKSRIVFSANGATADAKRIFAVMGLAVKCGDSVKVSCEGEDAQEAAEAIKAALEANL